MAWSVLFSIFPIIQGAWPVSLFLGAEYVIIVLLVYSYFRQKNINDQISINEKEIYVKKYKNGKLFYSSKFTTYWSKIFFTKIKNKSKLSIRESNKETEVATFLHTELKEALYNRINKQINLFRKQ